jgi:hypothetical protein
MEARQIIAYLLLTVIILAVFAVYRYATRQQRAHHRAYKAANRRTRERIEYGVNRL